MSDGEGSGSNSSTPECIEDLDFAVEIIRYFCDRYNDNDMRDGFRNSTAVQDIESYRTSLIPRLHMNVEDTLNDIEHLYLMSQEVERQFQQIYQNTEVNANSFTEHCNRSKEGYDRLERREFFKYCTVVARMACIFWRFGVSEAFNIAIDAISQSIPPEIFYHFLVYS